VVGVRPRMDTKNRGQLRGSRPVGRMTKGGSMPPVSAHQVAAERIQDELIRKMSPERRLEIACDLYSMAWEVKMDAIRKQHPDWSEQAVSSRTRRIFITGYAGD